MSKTVPASPVHRMLTPPQVAERLGVSPEKIIRWVRRGELRAVNVSETAGMGKPRFRIDPTDLAVFEQRRSVASTPKARRRRKPIDVTEYF